MQWSCCEGTGGESRRSPDRPRFEIKKPLCRIRSLKTITLAERRNRGGHLAVREDVKDAAPQPSDRDVDFDLSISLAVVSRMSPRAGSHPEDSVGLLWKWKWWQVTESEPVAATSAAPSMFSETPAIGFETRHPPHKTKSLQILWKWRLSYFAFQGLTNLGRLRNGFDRVVNRDPRKAALGAEASSFGVVDVNDYPVFRPAVQTRRFRLWRDGRQQLGRIAESVSHGERCRRICRSYFGTCVLRAFFQRACLQ